jgi:hypothetical protein
VTEASSDFLERLVLMPGLALLASKASPGISTSRSKKSELASVTLTMTHKFFIWQVKQTPGLCDFIAFIFSNFTITISLLFIFYSKAYPK